MNKWHLRLASVILSILLTLLIVATMQQMLEGKITANFMLTGLVAAIVVAFIISSLIICFLQLLIRLNQDNNHLNAIIMSCPVPIALYDNKQQILRLNPEFTKIFGYTIEDIPTLTDWWLKTYPEADYRQWVIDSWHARLQLSKLNNAAFEPLEVNIHCKNKMVKTIMTTVTPLDASFKGLHLVVLYDVSERKQIETELRIAATAFESQEGMIITDANSKILKINHSFTRITGFSSEEALGQKMTLLKSGMHDATFYSAMWDSIKSTGSWQGEIWNRRKNGDIYPEWLTITAVKDANEIVTHYVGTMIDITARKAIEERVHHLAHYDVLTDLPNRALLTDRLHQALAQVRRDKTKLALMFLDLDNFKPVNDSLGHEIGDLLLQKVAVRLKHCVKRESDTVSRIGGDEFVIILSHIEAEQDAKAVAEHIVKAISQPFNIDEHMINISISIGIAIYPTNGTDVNTLMKVADNAMYQAKQAGGACLSFYKPDIEIN